MVTVILDGGREGSSLNGRKEPATRLPAGRAGHRPNWPVQSSWSMSQRSKEASVAREGGERKRKAGPVHVGQFCHSKVLWILH